ncbi:cupin domain-containing protein [Thalassobacillus sp. CUG 92003]|uniref:cupin domain-containing protein n=1 Tax=Thalassobacillus sp. CUG 92003 TaxID=2736641 RepID=UPI0015E76C4C|nr:cupin domain-containing protein [Thalassobacillus sp. CUG 92003]
MYEPFISKYKEAEPFQMDEGVFFYNMVLREMGTKTLVVGLASFEPGASLPCHVHNVEESVTIIEGEAYCDVEGERTIVREYDTSFIPPSIPHRFVNASDTKELIILWMYSQVDSSLRFANVERIKVESNCCMLLENHRK